MTIQSAIKTVMMLVFFVISSVAQVKYIQYDEPPEPFGGYRSIHKAVVYPEEALKARVEGTVIILATITVHGEADSIVVLSGDPLLHQAAIEAITQLTWKPADHQGESVEAKVEVPVVFRLEQLSGLSSFSLEESRQDSDGPSARVPERVKLIGTIGLIGILYLLFG